VQMLLNKKQLVTIDIFYYRPDYRNLIQEFIWQISDNVPGLRRTHKFLNYWHYNIDAVVQEVMISIDERKYGTYKNVDTFLNMH
jgi:uncharacterized protein Usg